MDTKYPTKNWASALETIFKLLYTLEPSILHSEANNPNNAWLNIKPFDCGNKKISESLFQCKCSDTTSKIRLLRNFKAKYSIDEDELSFILWPLKEKNGSGEICQPRFEVTESLVDAFTAEWKRHVTTVGIFVARPWNPIHHIEDEVIHRELRPGQNPTRYATSVRQCHDFYEYLELNKKLFTALQTPENCAYLRNLIVATYLTSPNQMTAQTHLVALLTMAISQLLAG